MAKTRQEIIDFVSNRLFSVNYQELIFSDLSSAVGGLSANQKTRLMNAVLEGQELEVGKFLHDLMIGVAQGKADTEASSVMTDDNLTLTELQRIFP